MWCFKIVKKISGHVHKLVSWYLLGLAYVVMAARKLRHILTINCRYSHRGTGQGLDNLLGSVNVIPLK